MAYSYNEYIAGTNSDGSSYTIDTNTVFTAPSYLSGREATDIAVVVTSGGTSTTKVKDTHYTITGTAVKFLTGHLPSAGDKIRISRSSSQNLRLTDYVDSALLDADVMDQDANQLFYMAQEAIDASSDNNKGDNVKLTFGDGDDLQIYHDGSNSYIEQPSTGTGDLTIKGQTIRFRADDNTLNLLTDNNNVGLYYGGANKLSTTSTGVNVTGTVTADALTMGDNEKITLGAGGDLEIYHDASHSHILDKGTGSLSVDTAHFAVRSGATDDADTTPTEHIRIQVLAGASGTTAFSAGNESSGDLSTGMTNPRLEIRPISGSNAGQIVVSGKLHVQGDPVDNTKTGSGEITVNNNITSQTGNVISSQGDVEVISNQKGLILNSPNGTRYRLKVNDDGTLSTTAL